ncbi:MAG: transglycosylase SLT domain-containing protein, partial [Saprospiraceae bacterium]
MNKVFVFRLFVSALGLLSVLAWTNPVETDFTNSHLDEQEEIIRERIPTVVTIVSPIYNPTVRSYLNTYIYRRPEQTSIMLGWAAYYFPKFEKALQDEGMPTDLKYLSIVESALNPNAISRSGAGGLWQFMKPTARECGLKCGTYVDERMDPEKSTKAAVQYLKTLYRMFGNWELVMAAYNAGPGRVRSAVKRAGSNDYWKVAKYLPLETQSYVPGFIAASYLYNFHAQHNLVPVYPAHAMGELMPVVIHEGMSLPEVAKRSGLTVEIVKSLNPSFLRNYVPTSTTGYTIWLPALSAELFNTNRVIEVPALPMEVIAETEKIEAADVRTVTINGTLYNIRNTTKKYTVRSGDNLYTIANRNDCTVKELMAWNRLRSTKLAIGQRLEIKKEVRELVPVLVEVVPTQAVRNAQAIIGVPILTLASLTCKTS